MKFKRILSIILCAVMLLGLSVSVMAADPTTTVTITGVSTHEYKGYELLNASVGSGKFAYTINPKYKDIIVDALQVIDPAFPDGEADDVIIERIAAISTPEDMNHFSNAIYRAIQDDPATYTHDAYWASATTDLDQGYWLIAHVADLSGSTTETNSVVMIDTVGDEAVTIAAKPDRLNDEKLVDDENDSIKAPVSGNEDGEEWNTSADYDIGDLVPYEITGQFPNDVTQYKYYSFKIVDTASAGLTYKPDTFQLYVNGVLRTLGVKGAADKDFWYEIDTATNTLYVYPAYGYTTNAGVDKEANKDNGGDFLKTFPTGTDHSDINSSTFTFNYSCLLNENAIVGGTGNKNEQKIVFSNNPYGDTFGETLPNIPVVFTYTFIVNKVDTSGNPLAGATFALEKFVAVDTEGRSDDQMVTAGYFKHPMANSWGKWVVVDRLTVSGEKNHVFSFKGLDDGYYKLVEKEAPAGYHKIADLEFHIVATHGPDVGAGGAIKVLDLKATFKNSALPNIDGDETNGTLTVNIENRTGSELPSTGGMGTTILYIAGAVLVLAALVILVAKKRVASEG